MTTRSTAGIRNDKVRWRVVDAREGLDLAFRTEWTTVKSHGSRAMTFVAGDEAWLDLGDYADAAFWVDCRDLLPKRPPRSRQADLPRRKKR
jgi:hypothetical protein